MRGSWKAVEGARAIMSSASLRGSRLNARLEVSRSRASPSLTDPPVHCPVIRQPGVLRRSCVCLKEAPLPASLWLAHCLAPTLTTASTANCIASCAADPRLSLPTTRPTTLSPPHLHCYCYHQYYIYHLPLCILSLSLYTVPRRAHDTCCACCCRFHLQPALSPLSQPRRHPASSQSPSQSSPTPHHTAVPPPRCAALPPSPASAAKAATPTRRCTSSSRPSRATPVSASCASALQFRARNRPY